MKTTSEPLGCSEDVYAYAAPVFRRWKWEQEAFVVFALDAKHRMIGKPIVAAVGTASSVQVHPRDVFREAIRRNACCVIVSHCHPSGDLEPSLQDRELTGRLNQAAEVLGISLLDHVIVAQDAHYSMERNGRLR